MQFNHLSVMPNEVMKFLAHIEGKTVVDATAGGGGHLALLAKAVGPLGRVFAFDQDRRAHEDDAALGVAKQFHDRVTLYQQPFSTIKDTLYKSGVTEIDGLLCDLGVSSHQLDEKTRGFSFMNEGPIDMRMNQDAPVTAYEWLEQSSEKEIADVLFNFGGERKSRAVARAIKSSWPIENNTVVLAEIIRKALRLKTWAKIHPATRSFQAIRMAVNHEVQELVGLLHDVPSLLSVNGTAVFLSFHSVEDRLIKNRFKELTKAEGDRQFKVLTKKPLMATEEEINFNRRARSAKLRALTRIS